MHDNLSRKIASLVTTLLLCSAPALATEVELLVQEKQALFQQAEEYAAQGNYAEARDAYANLVKLAGEKRNSYPYFDLVLRLVNAELQLGNYEAVNSWLSSLQALQPPNDILPRITAIQAQVLASNNSVPEAFQAMQRLSSTLPQDQWDQEQQALYKGLAISLDQHYETLLRNADRLTKAELHMEALSLYEEVLRAIHNGFYPKVTNSKQKEAIIARLNYRLAHAYFESENYIQAIQVLEEQPATKSRTYRNSLYLLARAYNKIEDHATAITTAQLCLQDESVRDSSLYNKLQWELGFAHYASDHFPIAAQHLETIYLDKNDPDLFYVARLYLARIYLQQEEPIKAEAILSSLNQISGSSSSLHYELAYLKGELAYNNGNYTEAVRLFQQAIPSSNKKKARWLPDTLYNLGWSYLEQAQALSVPMQRREQLFMKAEDTFKELLSLKKSQKTTIALAKALLLQGKYNPAYRLEGEQKIELLLTEENQFSKIDYQAEALLLRAEAAQTFDRKMDLFSQLAQSVYRNTPSYVQGLFLQGIAEFDEATNLATKQRSTEADVFFNKATTTLEAAYKQLIHSAPSQAVRALSLAAQAQYHHTAPDSTEKALSLLDHLMQEHQAVLFNLPNHDELYLLRAKLAAQLIDTEEGNQYFTLAEESLTKMAESEASAASDQAKHLLASLYFQQRQYEKAEELFVALARATQDGNLAAESWYWAAESADKVHKAPEVARLYRMKLFDNYPSSPRAATAFFHFYSFTDYMQGAPEAMSHLQEMPVRYPHSPLLVVAYYLMGLENKQSISSSATTAQIHHEEAIHLFDKAQKAYTRTVFHKNLPTEDSDYYTGIYYRARLDAALSHLVLAEAEATSAHLDLAQEALHAILDDIQNAQTALFSADSEKATFSIWEEAQHSLIQSYLLEQNTIQLRTALQNMIDRYVQNDIAHSYYLALAWKELAHLAFDEEQYTTALEYFTFAADANKDMLSKNQQLDLWLKQAICLQHVGELDSAMLMLSRVINNDLSLQYRAQAMFLRGEIYATQGRTELAIKQLRAASQEDGIWANKAKDKLGKDYGFN